MDNIPENTATPTGEIRPEAVDAVKVALNHIRGRSGEDTSLTFASFANAARKGNWSTDEIVEGTKQLQQELGGNLEIVVKKKDQE